MRLSVATIVSRAIELAYPIEAVLESVAPIADEIVVNVDRSRDDGTSDMVIHWGAQRFDRQFRLVNSPWNWDTRDAGQELARQTNKAFEACGGDWTLYLQADEVLHEDDYDLIRWLMGVPEGYAGVEFVRLYFWRDLKTIRTDWTQPLVRMFRKGRGRAVGDAMNCQVDGLVWPNDDGLPRLYHYTRVADAGTIGRRIRNLDSLFHEPEELDDMRPYDFGLREVDGHLKGRDARLPRLDPSKVLSSYEGTHPKAMLKWLER